MQSLIELSLGTAIGAVTFTGSVIAFAKLNGNMSGAPIMLPARHVINIGIAALIGLLIVMMIQAHGTVEWHFWALAGLSLLIGILAHHSDRRRRHASRRLDAEFVLRLGRCGARLHA